MTIAIKQYQKIYNKVLLSLLKEGKIPSFDDILQTAGSRLPNPGEALRPTYTYIPQTPNAVFDIDIYNAAVVSIMDDLELAFEELHNIEDGNIQRIVFADLFHSLHSYELANINRQLDSLLFSLQGAEDNFFVQFENFKDLKKTNANESTQNIVDLYESCIALPISTKGTFKIDTSGLVNIDHVNIKPSVDGTIIVGNIPGTKFGNIFQDLLNAWGVIIDSPVSGKLDIEFSFKLDREEILNRITLLNHSNLPQVVTIKTSVDDVNIKDIIDYSNGVELSNQSEIVSLDFEDRLVEYVYIRISKNTYDSELTVNDSPYFRYTFGLKNISFYTTGRANTGTYVSSPFDFSSDTSSIGKVSISANERIPEGTNVEWSVALLDSSNNIQGSFIPITPESRVEKTAKPKIVTLVDTIEKSTKIVSADGTYSNIFTINSVDFYKISTILDEPIFGTAKLARGNKSWFRDKTGASEPIIVKDNFIPFSKSDVQSLYVAREEVVTLQTLTPGSSSTQIIALVSDAPLYDINKGHFLTPLQAISAGISITKDITPNYAIYAVILNTSQTSFILQNQNFSAGVVNLGKPYVFYGNAGDITVELINNDPASVNYNKSIQKFVDGKDFIIELDPNGFPTGRVIATQNSPLLSAHTILLARVDISYSINIDLTRFVTDIKNNQVFFSVQLASGTSVTIKYRSVPDSIIKSSLKAKNIFGTVSNKTSYTQGIDYTVDISSGTVQRLTTGTIPSGTDIYIDYQYNNTLANLEQFFIWAFISDPNGINVLLETQNSLNFQNTLVADLIAGEDISVNIPDVGLVSLTNAIAWPQLKGWVQFIVKSKSPDIANPAVTHFINQIIRLRDSLGNYIFIEGGKYFSSLTAIREPLRQVSLPFLKTNVLKNDNSKFAIDSVTINNQLNYIIIINFEPNNTENLYSYSVDQTTGNLVKISEEWRLNYISRQSSNPLTKVVVKAILSRLDELTNNITPKVFNYYIKVGY